MLPEGLESFADMGGSQQKRRPIAAHYPDKFKIYLEELRKGGVLSGPITSDSGYILYWLNIGINPQPNIGFGLIFRLRIDIWYQYQNLQWDVGIGISICIRALVEHNVRTI